MIEINSNKKNIKEYNIYRKTEKSINYKKNTGANMIFGIYKTL